MLCVASLHPHPVKNLMKLDLLSGLAQCIQLQPKVWVCSKKTQLPCVKGHIVNTSKAKWVYFFGSEALDGPGAIDHKPAGSMKKRSK